MEGCEVVFWVGVKVHFGWLMGSWKEMEAAKVVNLVEGVGMVGEIVVEGGE